MVLKIKPDFNSKTLKDCEQQLRITTNKDINEIKLDIAELDIENVHSLSSDYIITEFDPTSEEDKLIIKFNKKLPKRLTIDLVIKYSAGYNHVYGNIDGPKIRTPRSGFYFISSDENSSSKQAWTQGESIESRYWFPCIDDPEFKFPREIQITVPEGYDVISNGEGKQSNCGKENMTTWTWIEQKAISTYLTSVVIGNFSSHKDNCNNFQKNKNISLDYYWPKDIEGQGYDAMMTFSDTPNAMRIFEEYFGIEYPFEKYSQVAVDDFEFGGMENASCTTLTRDILHDKRASMDYNFDLFVVAHELAHQWFGDLVTCKEWSHIWLNEGFATFCEGLYWEKYWEKKDQMRKDDEFHYKMLQTADRYFSEANSKYKRPIVTHLYKNPEELFDDHSYRKGGCILHMLRHRVGDDIFKKSLKLYLERNSYKAVETDDLRKTLEELSGLNLQQFFNQWIYKAGHPELEIEYSIVEKEIEKNIKSELKIKITQVQEEGDDIPFEFPLEFKIVFSSDNNDKTPNTIQISQKVTEYVCNIPSSAHIKWISIDPEFKVLNEIKSLKIVDEREKFNLKDLLLSQLKNGKTVIEKIQAARILRDKKYSGDDDTLSKLQEVMVLKDSFYGVSVEVVTTLGSYKDNSDYSKNEKVYNALKKYFNRRILAEMPSQVRRTVVNNIGDFGKRESLDLLMELLQDESYYVESSAATAIGKCGRNLPISEKQKKLEIVQMLMDLVNNSKTFQNILAQGAINGLKEFSKDKNIGIINIDKLTNFLIGKTTQKNDYFIRYTATSALGKFLATENDETNRQVFDSLKQLLKDNRQRVKNNACTALADPDAKMTDPNERIISSLNELAWVAGHDLDGFVRRVAEDSLNIIRNWLKEWIDKPPKIDVEMRSEKGKHKSITIKGKEDDEQTLNIIRRPVLEY